MDIHDILRRYGDAKTRRSKYDAVFHEVGRYVWPPASTMVKTAVIDEAQVRTVDIEDSTAIEAAHRMASGIFSYLMPVQAKWFEFKARDYQLSEMPSVQEWMSKATVAVHSEIWRSNFQMEMFTTIHSLCVFGTGVISVEYMDGELFFRNYHIGDLFFDENSKQQIDTVYRRLFYTPRQAVQEFGYDNVSKKIRDALGSKSEERCEFVHAVFPNQDFNPQKKLSRTSKRFRSRYIEIETRKVCKDGSFHRNPYLAGRFNRSPDDIMGRSPGVEYLPEIKMLNAMKRTFLESSELQAAPPIIMEDNAIIGQPVIGPRSLLIKRPGTEDPHPFQTGANAQLNREVIEDQRNVVRQGFFADLFQALAQYRNMTAREVVERVEEKMVLLAPSISSLQKELFDPLIVRSLELLVEKDRIEPAPFEMKPEIVYQGRLALAMSNLQTNAIEATLAKWSPYLEMAPILDNIDLDIAFRTSALNAGVPAEILRDEDDRDEMRSDRKEREDMREMAEIGAEASKAIKNVAGADMGMAV